MPSRRDVIVGLPVLLAGCTDLQDGFSSDSGGDEIPSLDRIAGVYAVLVTEGYEDEPIVHYTDERIRGAAVLQTLIEMGVDTAPRPSGNDQTGERPKTVLIGHGDVSRDDLYEAVETLYDLPQREKRDWGIPKWYIEHPEQVLRVSYVPFD
ncbi:hypothetical protein PM030_16820 [Halorubrum ezzemoulense]|uniref:hypothetical protein n=1 Tax=Halorubrum ezzemoulense TaxID=337243 RepID=UPI00232EFD01|nr:hypothetical protein [Halorubrum ezzemoulense]MDB2283507.1 hypothetical protein [Halorubrum ezzemoulense]